MATETIVSPGVLLQEVDKSFVTPGTDPSGLAIIGPTARGPIEIPTQIKNYNDFKEQIERLENDKRREIELIKRDAHLEQDSRKKELDDLKEQNQRTMAEMKANYDLKMQKLDKVK